MLDLITKELFKPGAEVKNMVAELLLHLVAPENRSRQFEEKSILSAYQACYFDMLCCCIQPP